MKERKLTEERIIKELDKNGFIHIEPLCIDCVHDVIFMLQENYPSFTLQLEAIEDMIYSMKVML